MEAYGSMDPLDNYLFESSLRLGTWRTALLVFTLYAIYTSLFTLKS